MLIGVSWNILMIWTALATGVNPIFGLSSGFGLANGLLLSSWGVGLMIAGIGIQRERAWGPITAFVLCFPVAIIEILYAMQLTAFSETPSRDTSVVALLGIPAFVLFGYCLWSILFLKRER
jgi:hypothetical protein